MSKKQTKCEVSVKYLWGLPDDTCQVGEVEQKHREVVQKYGGALAHGDYTEAQGSRSRTGTGL